MASNTPRFGLNVYQKGENDWTHRDTVELFDELAVEADTFSNRPSTGTYANELYLSTNERLLYQWQSNTDSWRIVSGLGATSKPVPKMYIDGADFNGSAVNGLREVGASPTASDLGLQEWAWTDSHDGAGTSAWLYKNAAGTLHYFVPDGTK